MATSAVRRSGDRPLQQRVAVGSPEAHPETGQARVAEGVLHDQVDGHVLLEVDIGHEVLAGLAEEVACRPAGGDW